MAWGPDRKSWGADMAQAKTWAAFDVHVSGVVAATLDRASGELRVQRLAGRSDDVAAFAADLPGPVRATYEAGPTGFVLARKLEAIGVDCLVCTPGLIPRGPSDRVKTDRRDAERLVRLLAATRTELRAITEAKVKTDRRDARTLARLLAAGLLHGCWRPDETPRALRRPWRAAHAYQERGPRGADAHAQGTSADERRVRPRRSTVVAELELPVDERETVDGCLRQIDFLNAEIAILERGIAEHALHSDAIKRLMTVPGVSLMTATTFIAAVGDVRRFHEPRKLVSYLGLVPKVRQSGIGAARHGRISKQGAAQVRQMLAEAAFVAVSTAGPMRAFYERLRARRGSQIAIVAVARKLAVLFWHLLTRE